MQSDILIVLVVIAGPLIFAGVIVWIKSRERRKRDELKVELYSKALDSGRELPPDLFKTAPKNDSLKNGIILVSIGIGLALFMLLIIPDENRFRTASVGLIPFFIGVGFLVIHFVFKKKGYQDNE